jgi:methionyl-tRNA formyltransferase
VMPSFWMLANGETEAGVSIFVNDDIDAGELCAQRS